MDWNDLKIFLAVARTGTLGAAARLVGQTQPTIGRRIRALEASAGHTLFQRTNDGFVLTDEGMTTLAYAERVEEELLALERELTGQKKDMAGLLRISSFDWFSLHILTPLIAEFTRIYPNVSVELITDPRLFSLSRREADIAFRLCPFDDPAVVQRKLMRIDYALYLATDLAKPKLYDGTGSRLITLDSALAEMPDAAWLRKILPNAHVAFGGNNRDSHVKMCAAGVGIAVLPTLLGDKEQGIARLDFDEQPPSRDLYVGYHKDLRRLGRLRAFLDLTSQRLAVV